MIKVKWWSVLFWIICWHILATILQESLVLSSPITVIWTLFNFLQEKIFWIITARSLGRIVWGYLISIFISFVLALISSRYQKMRELLHPLVIACKSVPVVSFIILFLLWFDKSVLSITISLVITFPIIYTNILTGFMAMDQKIIEMADVFAIPLARRIRFIYFPHLLPYFNAAASLSLGISFKSGVAAELIALPADTIGLRLYEAKIYLENKDLLAWTLVILIFSTLLEKLITLLLKKVEAAL